MPLGVGADFEMWGVPPRQIVEMDWWDQEQSPDRSLSFVATPARHCSGRGPFG